jgi:AcrR family transcriptional regulator
MSGSLKPPQSHADKPARVRREPLSQERIAVATLRLIDEIGLDELSTRRLGAVLGCEAMAIYNHFASKDALLDAVVDRLFREVIVPSKGPGWEARVRGFAVSYRALAHAHPKAFPLLATRRFRTEARSRADTPKGLPNGARDLVEQIVSALLEEGFEPREAAELFRLVASYCNGAILDEISGAFPPAKAGEHPNIERVQRFLAPEHYDAMFERGLTLLLAGFSPRA